MHFYIEEASFAAILYVRTINQVYNIKYQKTMKHLILTETAFFRRISKTDGKQETSGIQSEYSDFIGCAIALCCETANPVTAYIALSYAEVELQHLWLLHGSEMENGPNRHCRLYADKALAFIRKMLEHVSKQASQVPPLSTSTSTTATSTETTEDTPAFRWTGKASDLVEILYGIDELDCINNGESTLKEIAAYFYRMLGVEAKECYNIYADIKLRKNESRTYFLDKMQERVNRRMRMDEERERMRR